MISSNRCRSTFAVSETCRQTERTTVFSTTKSHTQVFKNLLLNRPLAVIDLETTGTDPKTDRIVEIAVVRILPDGTRVDRCRRVNPGVPIPEAATKIHGIADTDVKDEPGFDILAPRLAKFLDGCDLCGFNLKRFDLRLLIAEFDRAGHRFPLQGRKIVDPLEIYHGRERRDLSAAVRFYCGKEHEGAHGASADVQVTLEILDAMLDRYPDLPRSVDELHDVLRGERAEDLDGKFFMRDGRVVFNFGKYKGRRLDDVTREYPDYINWLLEQSFLDDAKELMMEAQHRISDSGARIRSLASSGYR
jgi:DNA polymerase-3 subunit epsilon